MRDLPVFRTIEEPRCGLRDSIAHRDATRLVARHGRRTPDQIRVERRSLARPPLANPLGRPNSATHRLSDQARRSVMRLPPVRVDETPGEESTAPHGLAARALARERGVPPNRIIAVLNGGRAVTAKAPPLARRFGTSAGSRMNLRTAHDLEPARAPMGEAA